mmetsp:Transcript_50122/g.92513  ORF Transcript_50122/g.92513 Transcript_50122/m.92513 type:complete len:266 (+) Transcript_50122:48-845(+)
MEKTLDEETFPWCCEGEAQPSTPKQRRHVQRTYSFEKLPSVPRKRQRSPDMPRAVSSSLQHPPASVDFLAGLPEGLEHGVAEMQSRANSDIKYWAQIVSAHRLLSGSASSELKLREAAAMNETLLLPLFANAIEEQSIERMNATVMLQVLEQLVVDKDRSSRDEIAANTPAHTTIQSSIPDNMQDCATPPGTPPRRKAKAEADAQSPEIGAVPASPQRGDEAIWTPVRPKRQVTLDMTPPRTSAQATDLHAEVCTKGAPLEMVNE